MSFDASLRGIDLNEVSGRKGKKVQESKEFTFQSPEEYETMSMEERKALTERMMGKHKLKFG